MQSPQSPLRQALHSFGTYAGMSPPSPAGRPASVPAPQSGVRTYASSEQFQPVMVKPETSSSRLISQAR